MHKRIPIVSTGFILFELASTAAPESPSSQTWGVLAGYKSLELDYS